MTNDCQASLQWFSCITTRNDSCHLLAITRLVGLLFLRVTYIFCDSAGRAARGFLSVTEGRVEPAMIRRPEDGELVHVRSRQWVVNDVKASTFPSPATKADFSGPQNLISLSSVEDDGMTELLYASRVRLGLVTNGEYWMLVDAPKRRASEKPAKSKDSDEQTVAEERSLFEMEDDE